MVPEFGRAGAYAALVEKSCLGPTLGGPGDFGVSLQQIARSGGSETVGIRRGRSLRGGSELGAWAESGSDGFVDHSVGGAGRDQGERMAGGDNQAVSEVVAVLDDAATGPASDPRSAGVKLCNGIVAAKVAKGDPRAVPAVEPQDWALGGIEQRFIEGHVVKAVEGGGVCEHAELREKHPANFIGTGWGSKVAFLAAGV